MSEKNPLRVLLAEDNPGDVAILEHILTGIEIELRHCASLTLLKEHGKTWDPDVVLLDLHLEDSQDFMVTARTVVSFFPHIPIVALTSLDNEEFALRALQSGISAYLIKGTLSGEDLMKDIRKAQARKRAQQTSLPPSLRQNELRELLHEAVNTALTGPEENVEKLSPKAIAFGTLFTLFLLGGTGGWGYHKISKIRNAPEPTEEVQKDKRDMLFQEFEDLRNQYAERRHRWEVLGKKGSRPERPARLLQLEQELAQ